MKQIFTRWGIFMTKHDCPECLISECKDIIIKNGKCLKFATDNISSASHRLYRGLILPALTEALGESNNQYVHDFILKPEWIYRQTGNYYFKVDKFDDIPIKHQGDCRVITIINSSGVHGLHVDTKIVGFIPSMANFTRAETKDFFRFCEVLLEEIGGAIPTDQNQEYKLLRGKVLK